MRIGANRSVSEIRSEEKIALRIRFFVHSHSVWQSESEFALRIRAKFRFRYANRAKFAFRSAIFIANSLFRLIRSFAMRMERRAYAESELSESAEFQQFALNSHSEIRSAISERNSEFAFALNSHSENRSSEM